VTQPNLGRDQEIAPAQLVLPRVRAVLPSLQRSDARVAQAILDQPEAVIYQSVSELAELADTSTATVVRCAQKLGFKGFHDLKLALAQELSAFRGGIAAHDERLGTAEAVLARVTAAGAQIVRDAGALVNPEAFAAAVTALAAARHILCVGVGTSGPLAQDAAYRFRTIGLHAEAPGDVHVQHVASRLLQTSDVCVAISHTGATRETLDAVSAAKTAGAGTIAVTSFMRSPLTELADVVLTAGSREVSFRLEAMASRLAHMAVIDALLVAVAESDETRAQAALDLYASTLADHRY
jgi:DNA-binding MurR/RpiR family transcriptional regulator